MGRPFTDHTHTHTLINHICTFLCWQNIQSTHPKGRSQVPGTVFFKRCVLINGAREAALSSSHLPHFCTLNQKKIKIKNQLRSSRNQWVPQGICRWGRVLPVTMVTLKAFSRLRMSALQTHAPRKAAAEKAPEKLSSVFLVETHPPAPEGDVQTCDGGKKTKVLIYYVCSRKEPRSVGLLQQFNYWILNYSAVLSVCGNFKKGNMERALLETCSIFMTPGLFYFYYAICFHTGGGVQRAKWERISTKHWRTTTLPCASLRQINIKD